VCYGCSGGADYKGSAPIEITLNSEKKMRGTITWIAGEFGIPDYDSEESAKLDTTISVQVLVLYDDKPITIGRYWFNSDHWVLTNYRGPIERSKLFFAYINYPQQ